MKQTHDFLAKLQGVRPAGDDRWYARCPAHDDSSPSLSIRDMGDKLLLNCFAGCNATDVLSAIGMEWKDIYPDRWKCAAKRSNPAVDKYEKGFRRKTGNYRVETETFDPMDIERMILAIAAEWQRQGKPLGVEDEARVEVALLRMSTARYAA